MLKSVEERSKAIGAEVTPSYQPRSLLADPPSAADVTLELLLASEAHQGHATPLWNSANARYIYGVRQGIHIISLEATAAHLRRAAKVVSDVSRRGGIVLFVGTRPKQDRCVVRAAELAQGCHLFERWIPGSITNGQQILGKCRTKVVDEFDREVLGFEDQLRERQPLRPDLVVCLNPMENYVLLHECALNTIATIGVIDTNADPTWVTYPIPANDDRYGGCPDLYIATVLTSPSLRCIQVIAGVLGRAGQAGQKARHAAAEAGIITYSPAQQLRPPKRQQDEDDIDEDEEEDDEDEGDHQDSRDDHHGEGLMPDLASQIEEKGAAVEVNLGSRQTPLQSAEEFSTSEDVAPSSEAALPPGQAQSNEQSSDLLESGPTTTSPPVGDPAEHYQARVAGVPEQLSTDGPLVNAEDSESSRRDATLSLLEHSDPARLLSDEEVLNSSKTEAAGASSEQSDQSELLPDEEIEAPSETVVVEAQSSTGQTTGQQETESRQPEQLEGHGLQPDRKPFAASIDSAAIPHLASESVEQQAAGMDAAVPVTPPAAVEPAVPPRETSSSGTDTVDETANANVPSMSPAQPSAADDGIAETSELSGNGQETPKRALNQTEEEVRTASDFRETKSDGAANGKTDS